MIELRGLLRIVDGRPYHWCPACQRMHPLPSDTGRWQFNGDHERPTFTPSFRHSGGPEGQGWVCHYILTDGVLNYCTDCTHAMAGQQVPLPPIPESEKKEP